MNIHSFDSYSILRINKRKYKIQKLNFKKTMEYLIIYNAYVNMLTAHELFCNKFNWFEKKRSLRAIKAKKNDLMECIGIPKYRQKDFKQIIKYVSEKIECNKVKSTDKKTVQDSNSIQGLIAYFALHFGWNKEQVFSLYPEEISIIMQKNEILLDIEALRSAAAQLAPKDFVKGLEAKQELDNKGSEAVELASKKRIDNDINREIAKQAERTKRLKNE